MYIHGNVKSYTINNNLATAGDKHTHLCKSARVNYLVFLIQVLHSISGPFLNKERTEKFQRHLLVLFIIVYIDSTSGHTSYPRTHVQE